MASERLPYGEGVFRRRFLLRSRDGCVVADMEDDFHRFRVELFHDGERVTEARGEAFRYPWTECPGAADPLRALAGMKLSEKPTATAAHTDPRANCTHMFDVATLAVTHAAAGRDRRQYDIAIPDREKGRAPARLWRDGELFLDWEVDGYEIAQPHKGVSMRGTSFVEWTEQSFPPETAEAVLALRRASFIAMGRYHDLDDAPDATVYLPLAKNSCHTFTPGTAEKAHRMKGSTHDFTHRPNALLADAVRGVKDGDVLDFLTS